MTYNEYITGALETATYPKGELGLLYLRLGLRGEAGEVLDKVKKLIRDDGWEPGQPVPEEKRQAILLELGDVLWYCACYAHETNTTITLNDDREMQRVNAEGASLTYLLFDMFEECASQCFTYVVWNVAAIAQHLGSSLNEVARMNLEKLASRKQRGALGGSGDYR